MNQKVFWAGLSAALVLAGCSSSSADEAPARSDADARVEGTVAGQSLEARDAVLIVENTTVEGLPVTHLEIRIDTQPGVCPLLEDDPNQVRAGSRLLSLSVFGIGTRLAADTYPIAPDPRVGAGPGGPGGPGGAGGPPPEGALMATASAEFGALGARCDVLASETATTGTLTLVSVTDESATGRFEVGFANGKLTGNFEAKLCAKRTASAPPDGRPAIRCVQ